MEASGSTWTLSELEEENNVERGSEEFLEIAQSLYDTGMKNSDGERLYAELPDACRQLRSG